MDCQIKLFYLQQKLWQYDGREVNNGTGNKTGNGLNRRRGIMRGKWIQKIVFILFLMSCTGFVHSKGKDKDKEQDELVYIGILPYQNNTGRKDYDYLKLSLTEVIKDGMHRQFIFHDVSMGENRVVFTEIKKESLETAQKNKKYAKKIQAEKTQIARIGAEKKADIVIYGVYTYDINSNIVKFSTRIYFQGSDTLVDVPTVSNPVDDTIFNSTDRVSGQIVTKIQAIYNATAKTEDKQKEKPESIGKIKLEKNRLVVEKPRKWLVYGEALGVSIYGSANVNYSIDSVYFVGGGGTFVPRPDFNFLNANLLGGYRYRWLFFQLGTGLYIISYENETYVDGHASSKDVTTNGIALSFSVGGEWYFWKNRLALRPLVTYIFSVNSPESSVAWLGLGAGYRF